MARSPSRLRIGLGTALGAMGFAVLAAGLVASGVVAACHSPEPVIPFMDAGDPCATASTNRAIDCSEYPETTCVVPGSMCPRVTYGCADAGYFTRQDDSECPPEGGHGDASFPGDASFLGDSSPGFDGGGSDDAPADGQATTNDAGDASAD